MELIVFIACIYTGIRVFSLPKRKASKHDPAHPIWWVIVITISPAFFLNAVMSFVDMIGMDVCIPNIIYTLINCMFWFGVTIVLLTSQWLFNPPS